MGFFGDLVNGLVGDFSEVVQCTKFTEAFNNVGAFEGMNETEKNSFILNALESCGAATTPDTLLGEIYPIVVKAANENAVNLSQPVAHESCPAKCVHDRNTCGECLKARLEIFEALNYAEHPEEYRRIFNAAAQAPSSDASAEGELGASARFVPSSSMSPEQQAYELIYKHQQEEINTAYSPELKKVMINIQCAASWSVCPTMPKAELLRLTEESINETLLLLKAKMSLSDLYYMADYYHMSVPTYLRGLFAGDPNLKTAAVLRKEQQAEREREIRQQQAERDRQIREEKEAKLKQIQQENHRRQLDMIKNKAPQYVAAGGGGGSSRCCGTCVHYMSASNRCTEHTYSPNGASDWCSSYSSR